MGVSPPLEMGENQEDKRPFFSALALYQQFKRSILREVSRQVETPVVPVACHRVITISREFGSGGRTIGKEVAEKLGLPCYDSELIEKISAERLHDKDRRRKACYELYTGTQWGQADNYDLCLDSGRIGIGQCVNMIAELYQKQG